MNDVWAAFNLETDPDNFDFEVALGAAITSNPEPEETTIHFHSLDERVSCRVFIHGDPSAKRGRPQKLPVQKLEIISPLNRDGVTSECQKQLSLALRLFESNWFWFSSWERRSEVRVSGTGLPLYSLRGNELTNFCSFSKRLLGFHRERNVYLFGRYWVPLLRAADAAQTESLTADFLGKSDPSGESFLSQTAHLMIATDFFEQAYRDWHLSDELSLMLLIMAAEALFGDDDKSELSYRLSHRISVLNGGSPKQRKNLFDLTRTLYGLRSRIMHGSLYRKGEGFIEVLREDISPFGNLVRASLLYFIALKGIGKRELLQILDRAVFDEAEVLRLRFKANEFWGFGQSADEHLFAASWSQ